MAAPCARLQLVRGPVRKRARARPFNGIVSLRMRLAFAVFLSFMLVDRPVFAECSPQPCEVLEFAITTCERQKFSAQIEGNSEPAVEALVLGGKTLSSKRISCWEGDPLAKEKGKLRPTTLYYLGGHSCRELGKKTVSLLHTEPCCDTGKSGRCLVPRPQVSDLPN